MPAPRFLADEDFRWEIVRAIRTLDPELDLATVQELTLRGLDDADILQFASDAGRIVLTHDRSTMTAEASLRFNSNLEIAGLIVVPQTVQPSLIADQLVVIAQCSDASEWVNVVSYLPW